MIYQCLYIGEKKGLAYDLKVSKVSVRMETIIDSQLS